MGSNVITFTARPKSDRARPALRRRCDNVISFAGWLGRAMPHRTPTGVFFTTQVLVTPGDTA